MIGHLIRSFIRRLRDRPPDVLGEWTCPTCGTRVVIHHGDPVAVAAALDAARSEHVCTSSDSS